MLLGGEQRGRDAAEEHFLESISLGRLPGLAAEMGGERLQTGLIKVLTVAMI